MDASQYKDYVLVLLFVKYVSDKYAGDPNGLISVPDGGGFADMVTARRDVFECDGDRHQHRLKPCAWHHGQYSGHRRLHLNSATI